MKPEKKSPVPPPWALRFFRWYCHPDFVEDIEGDLQEIFEQRVRETGLKKSRLLFIRDVLVLCRPSLIRSSQPSANTYIQPAMFKNYCKVGFRNLWKYKSYATLNILGLSVGIAAAILLFLIIQYENSFDKFHSDYQHIYRLGETTKNTEGENTYYATKTPVIPALLDEFPEVVHGTRFRQWNNTRLDFQNKSFMVSTHYVDSGFVHMFDFPILAGDLASALKTPDRIVLTQSVAEKFFGREKAVGQTLSVTGTKQNFIVGAVVKDPPKNSSMQFETLIPWLNAPKFFDLDQAGDWYNTFMEAYVQLAPGSDPKMLEKKLIPFKDKNFTSQERGNVHIILLPIAQLHAEESKNTSVITLLSVIAIITLTIACINFMNLSTAQSLGRAREIGLRKVMGSYRTQLIFQFLSESFLACMLALVLAIISVHLILPWFNRYFDMGLTFQYWQNIRLLLALLGLGILTSLIAGAYPAFFISGFNTITSLKGNWKNNTFGRKLQQGLIVLQYVCSILLIAGTTVIWQQIQFMKSQGLRLDQHNVVVMNINVDQFKDQQEAQNRINTFKKQLENETTVTSVAFSEKVPGRLNENYNTFYAADNQNQIPVSLRQTTVGDNYFPTLGIHIVEGRDFSNEMASDSMAVIINQTAMKALGWQDIQDKYLYAGEFASGEKYKVVGVTEDYFYESLQYKIGPLVHFYWGKDVPYGSLTVKLQPNRTAEGLEVLNKNWNALDPYQPLDYFFLDQEFDNLYKAQERLGITASLFAFIAVVLASLGLFSLAAFATRQRRKEVGVRKVLGASISNILVLLSGNFALLVLIAFLIACPLIYYASEQFLRDFAYRIEIGAGIFISTGLIAFMIAGFSVGFQALKAATINPTQSLRDD